jgi:RNA polymerase sigma-70 factor (ECF subfamily)
MDQGPWERFSDSELVVAALVGDLTAFDALVVRFRPAVLAVARAIVGPEAAEDVAQEAFLLAFKALPQLEEASRFGAWLHAITRHRALRFQQQNGREILRADVDELILAHSQALGPRPTEALERQETDQEVREELAKIPEACQIVLHLRYWEEMPCQRIADFLGLPLTTVKWRLHHGKDLLRARLLRRWQGEP